jgi:anti-sigma factor RsiW
VRLEGYLDGAESEELAAHLERCPACQEALEDARMARELLREGREPAAGPSGAFATRVMAGIRAEEARRQQFWRPLELLASRLAVVAAMVLLALTVYVYESGPARYRAQGSSRAEVSEGFPELGGQASQDEVLLTLSGNGNGR